MLVGALSVDFPSEIILGVVAIPVLYGLMVLGLSKGTSILSKDLNIGSVRSSTGGSFYDTAIEPEESWYWVNERIEELNKEDKVHPYRKISTDRSNKRQNRKTRQETFPATIDGRETRLTILIGRPQTGDKYKEMIGYLVDLKKPSIADYKGNIREGAARRNASELKKLFFIERGGERDDEVDERKRAGDSPYVQINDSGGE